MDHAANRFLFKPYSCEACEHRFYVLRRDVNAAAIRAEIHERWGKIRSRRKSRRKSKGKYFYGLAVVAIGAIIYFLLRQRS